MIFPAIKNRLGVCFDFGATCDTPDEYDIADLNPNFWFYDYSFAPHGNCSSGSGGSVSSPLTNQYQMVWNAKTTANNTTKLNQVGSAANNYTGKKWLIGNEPDVQSQNTPAEYAHAYGTIYTTIKANDPNALVYAMGLGAASPMRLRWATQCLDAYNTEFGTAMPVDGFHWHIYLLPESGSFGIGSAFGVSGGTADARNDTDYWIDYSTNPWTYNHANPTLFKADVVALRLWMYESGYQSKPLIISEYGVLTNQFPNGTVTEYMSNTFDWSLTRCDPYVGCSNDEYRLIQELAWFSVNYDVYSFPTLFNRSDASKTFAGTAYKDYYNQYLNDSLLPESGDIELIQENGNLIQTG